MANNPKLLGLIQNIIEMPNSNSTTLGNAISDIMYAWAGVDNISPWSAGPMIDGQQLGFLEQFLGIPFLDAHGNVAPKYSPETNDLKQSWSAAFKGIAARLLLQGPMATTFSDFTFNPTSDLIVCTTSFSQAVQDVAAHAPADSSAAQQFWWAATTILDQFVMDWQQIDSLIGTTVVPTAQSAYDALLGQTVPLLTASTLALLRTETFTGYAGRVESSSGTIAYVAGSGVVQVESDAGPGNVPTVTLVFGAGITTAQLGVSSDAQGNLYLSDGIAGDQIRIEGMMVLGGGGSPEFGVQSVQLADGTELGSQQLIALAETASPTNTMLYGFHPGGKFVYAVRSGQVEVNQDAGFDIDSAAVLQFGPGTSAAQVTATADAEGDLYLTDGTADDRIQLDGELKSAEYGVAQVQFADGTALTAQQLITLATTGSPTNTELYGTPGADTFDGRGYATYEQGSGGGDTFVYNQDYGQLEISEIDPSQTSNNVLQLGPGITTNQVTVSGDGHNDLVLTDGVNGDQIKIDNGAISSSWGNANGVQSVRFADGTVWTGVQLVAAATTGTPGADTLYGSSGLDIFDGKGTSAGSQDYEQGNGGADTFVYNRGYGQVEVNEDAGAFNSSGATLQLGAGITAAQLSATSDSSGDLYLADGTTGDQIKIDGMLNLRYGSAEYGVGSVQFADGTAWTAQQLIGLADTASPTNTVLYGFQPQGTFTYAAGNGNVEVNEDAGAFSGSSAVLQLGGGISEAQLRTTSDSSGNLYVTDGTNGDQIKIDGMLNLRYGYAEYGVSSIQFADGATWTGQQLINLNTTGAPGKTQLYGSAGADIFDSRGYATYEQGNGGADTFVYNRGYGQVEVNEDAGAFNSSGATLQLGAGITAAQLSATSDSSGDLYLADGTTGDQIKIDGMLNLRYGSAEYGVGSVQFADGTAWTAQQLIGLADTASPTNTVLYGFQPQGTFTYAAGNGNVEVNEDAGAFSGSSAVLQLGGGISEAQLRTTSDSSGNLYVTDGTNGDQIKIDGMLNLRYGYAEYGVSSIQFADGATWTGQQLINLNTTGAPGKTQLYGSAGADIFDSRGYATYEQGNGGADTFVYNRGYGQVEVNEDAGAFNSSGATLQLGAGITAAQLSATSDSSGDLYLADGTTGDQIKIDGMLNLRYGSAEYGVGSVQFADGTAWTAQQLIGLADTASPTNTVLYGFQPQGTFTYAAGNGNVEVNEDAGAFSGSSAVLQLGGGISEAQLRTTSDSSGNLYVTDGTSGDQIKIDGMLNLRYGYAEYGVSSIQFADDTGWTRSQLAALATGGTTGSDTITGTSGDDIFDGHGGADTINGSGGNDTYLFRQGYGMLTIDNSIPGGPTAQGKLDFSTGITEQNLWLSQTGSDLIAQILGSLDVVDVKGWFGSNPSAQLAELKASDGLYMNANQANQLVAAMATYQASNPGFNPTSVTSMPNDLNLKTAIGTYWHS